jgi:hypothetical protein
VACGRWQPDVVGTEDGHGVAIFAEARGNGLRFVEPPFAVELDGQIAVVG